MSNLYPTNQLAIAVIVPCYKSKDRIISVLKEIKKGVREIIIVDDCCPELTGEFVQHNYSDSRIQVLFHKKNLGVGGAMKTGYKHALKGNCEIFVKLDSDGQMTPEIMPNFTVPIERGIADYCKGNRFYDVESVKGMPIARLIGNAGLSFLTKLSSGYWNVMDPTNGYLAVHRKVVENLPIDKLDNRFFFESEMLFRMNTIGAVVLDIPMNAVYDDEKSNLSVIGSLFSFSAKHLKLFFKRIFYNYFLRDFSVATINLVVGSILFFTGLFYGYERHRHFAALEMPTPTGVQVLVLILLLIGFQLLLSFINYDISRTPKTPISKLLPDTD